MNFPILYTSTHFLSNAELKKYIYHFQEHILNFTLFDGFRLVSYHKYIDELYIRLEWFVQSQKRNEFKAPLDLIGLFALENNGIIEYKRGNIVHYSRADLITAPNDETYNIFYSVIRKSRKPLRVDEYQTLEFPKYTIETKLADEQLFNLTRNYQLFQDYLENRKPKKKNSKTQKKDKLT